jgi:hypothetical protein
MHHDDRTPEDRDEIADLADRALAMSEFEFAIEWGSLTEEERDAVRALE